MPKFATKVDTMTADHPVKLKNKEYARKYYDKYGHTQEYKDRKKREYIRRKEHYAKLKSMEKLFQEAATTARTEICCCH